MNLVILMDICRSEQTNYRKARVERGNILNKYIYQIPHAEGTSDLGTWRPS